MARLAAEILADPSASFWLKAALTSALERDCVDAANDAELLAEVLAQRANEILVEAMRSAEAPAA
ncbi:MAG: hypothetical protein ACREPQ_14080 [Rhodanobacter sp.]